MKIIGKLIKTKECNSFEMRNKILVYIRDFETLILNWFFFCILALFIYMLFPLIFLTSFFWFLHIILKYSMYHSSPLQKYFGLSVSPGIILIDGSLFFFLILLGLGNPKYEFWPLLLRSQIAECWQGWRQSRNTRYWQIIFETEI